MKWCKWCETEKPLAQFHNNGQTQDGKSSRCILCVRALDKERRERQAKDLPPRRVCRVCKIEQDTFKDFSKGPNSPGGYQTLCKSCSSENSALFRWGIPNILKLVDEGYCEICKEKLLRNNYAVDHDHSCCNSNIKSCGKCIRGLICQKCNHGLGNFREKPELMQTAIDYLRKYNVLHER